MPNQGSQKGDWKIRRFKGYQEGRLGVEVQLYRDASGSNVIRFPNEKWLSQMKSVSEMNYGEICIVMNPTMSLGYNDEFGLNMIILPGTSKGYRGDSEEMWLRSQVSLEQLPLLGDNGAFQISTSIRDAVNLYNALGAVIRNMQHLTKKAKLKNKSVNS